MKQRLMAAAVVVATLAASAGGALAGECGQILSGNQDCREIDAADLGDEYCVASIQTNVVAVGPHSGSTESPWHTKKDIDLDNKTGSGSAAGCKQSLDFSGGILNITPKGTGYEVSVTNTKNANMQSVPMVAVTEPSGKHDLWLTETDKSTVLRHFIFFRNQKNPSNGQLPKYLVIEALDLSNSTCQAEAPDLKNHATIAAGHCAADDRKPLHGGFDQTGVGGGGERP